MTKVLCIFHAHCADGLGAAWAVHKALGPDVEFVAAKYGDLTVVTAASPELRGRDILIVDFSYPLEVLRAMAQEARSVLVLDHHATAQEDLVQVPTPDELGAFSTYKGFASGCLPGHNLAAIFDMKRSGAGLTHDYLNPGKPRPRIIDLIEDRDLWKFKFGDESKAFHAVLTSYDIADLPTMFKRLDDWDRRARNHKLIAGDTKTSRELKRETRWESLLDEGAAILRANSRAVATAVAASRRTIRIASYTVPCANVPGSMASDAVQLLCRAWSDVELSVDTFTETYLKGQGDEGVELHYPTFSATYYDGSDGKRHFYLRSPEGGAHVGNIAKAMAEKFNADPETQAIWQGTKFAGGGHEHAAGFDAPLNWEGE